MARCTSGPFWKSTGRLLSTTYIHIEVVIVIWSTCRRFVRTAETIMRVLWQRTPCCVCPKLVTATCRQQWRMGYQLHSAHRAPNECPEPDCGRHRSEALARLREHVRCHTSVVIRSASIASHEKPSGAKSIDSAPEGFNSFCD